MRLNAVDVRLKRALMKKGMAREST